MLITPSIPAQPEFGYVNPEYLQIASNLFAPVKQQSYERLRAKPGLNFLDVGCGAGIDTCALATYVQSNGTIAGVDADLQMVQQANARIKQRGRHSSPFHIHARASALPFSNGAFDGTRSERLFMHLSDGLSVLSEMSRVTKPQGWIVVAETDWNSLSMATSEPTIFHMLSQLRVQGFLTNGYSAQQLYGQFSIMKLQSILIDIIPIFTTDIGLFRFLTKMDELEELAIQQRVLTAEEAAAWYADQNVFKQGQPFWGSVNVLLISGQAPS